MPAPPVPTLSDEQVIGRLTRITIAFCLALVAILAIGVLFLVPNGSVTTKGLAIGVALGVWSYFGSWGVTANAITRAERSGLPVHNAAGLVLAGAFMGIAFAEAPALVGLALAVVDGKDVGPLVISIPVAIAAIIVNASGPGVVRRRLARLRG